MSRDTLEWPVGMARVPQLQRRTAELEATKTVLLEALEECVAAIKCPAGVQANVLQINAVTKSQALIAKEKG